MDTGPFERKRAPTLEDTVLFLIIQNFQTLYYHIKDTRCQHVVTKENPGRKPAWTVPVAWAVLWPAQSRRHLPLRGPHSQPEAEQACGCPHGRPVPESGPWGSPGRPVASASSSGWPSFCPGPCSAEGGQCQGPAETQCRRRLGPCAHGVAGQGSPLSSSPRFPGQWGGEHTAAQPEL